MSALAGVCLAASLLGAEPVSSAAAAREVSEIFEQPRYLFCRADNDYISDPPDHRWCELAATSDARGCPGFERVCVQGFDEGEFAQLGEDQAGEPTSPDQPSQGHANPGARRDQERVELELPDLGGFAEFLMWALLIGIVVGVVVAVAKNFVRDKDDDGLEPDAEPDTDASSSLIAARAVALRVVETDVQRLLAQAEDLSRSGDDEAAINNVYAALLRRLEGGQLIAVDRWKTNGDYLRALRARPGLRDEVGEIVREVEQVQFGAAAASGRPDLRGRYQTIRARVLAIVSRATLGVVLALGLGAHTACDPGGAGDADERPDSSALAGLGTGPSGQRAIGELLLGFDIEARHRAQSIEQLAQTDGAIVLLDALITDEDWQQLLRWVEDDGGMLVIANGQPFPRSIGVDYTLSIDPDTELLPGSFDRFFDGDGREYAAPAGRTLDLRGSAHGHANALLVRPPVLLGLPSEDQWQAEAITLGDKHPYVLRRELGDAGGSLVVFAEPDMFTNAALLVADNGAFLLNLFRRHEIEQVEFINGYTGAGADDPFESVRNASLGALFLQILVFLALLYAALGIPFARLRDPPRQRRRSFAEHVRTLGQRYAQARAARHVASIYSAWALDRLRERLQPGSAHGLHPLAQAIAARTGRNEGAVMQTLVQAHELRETDAHSTRGGPADLALMRELAALLDETGGAR